MNKLMKKIAAIALGITMAAGVGVGLALDNSVSETKAIVAGTTDYILTFNDFNITGNSYKSCSHTYSDGATITLSGSKQTTNITNNIVTKGAEPVVLKIPSDADFGIKSFTFSTIQWLSKSQTLTGYYSTDNGISYTALTPTASAGKLLSVVCPDDKIVNAIKIGFSSSNSQIGLDTLSVTYASTQKKGIDHLETTPANGAKITVDASGEPSVERSLTYKVFYDDTTSDFNAAVSINPSAGVTHKEDGSGTSTLTFTTNGTYTVTVSADEAHTSVIEYTISNIPAFVYEKYTGTIRTGDYVIMSDDTSNTYVLGNTVESNRVKNGATAPTVTEDQIINPNSAYVWHIAKSGDAWTIRNVANNKYLVATSSKNQANLLDDPNEYATWNISYDSRWIFENVKRKDASSDSANRFLRNNTTLGWAAYTSTQSNAPALFRLAVDVPEIDITIDGKDLLGVGDTATLKVTKSGGATGTVNWSINDEGKTSVELDKYTGDEVVLTALEKGKATVTASLEGCEPVSVSFKVRNGTEESPYTIPEAIEAIDTGTAEEKTDVCTIGVVSKVDGELKSDKSLTYWITETGLESTVTLQIYHGKGLNNTDFSSADDLQEGDNVVVFGTLKKYNTTYEYDSGNYLKSFERPVVNLVDITRVEGSLNAMSGDTEWDLSPLSVFGHTNVSGTTEVNVSLFVDIDTEDVPGVVTKTTTRDVAITACGKDDPSISLTQNVSGTIKKANGALESGRYFIYNSNGALENKNYTTSTSTKVDIAKTSAWDFTIIDDNTYSISNNQGQYLYCSADNSGLRTKKDVTRWTLTALTGEDYGKFSLTSSDGSNIRYLCGYYTDSKNDWRTYKEASKGDMYKLSIVEEKTVFADNLLGYFTEGCTEKQGYVSEKMHWNDAKTQFETLSEANKAVFKNNTTEEATILAAIARYDRIVTKYGTAKFADFMNRFPDGVVPSSHVISLDSDSNAMLITIVTVSALTIAVGGYFFIRKKKHSN